MALVGLCRWPSAVPRMDHDGIFPRLSLPSASGIQVTALLWAAMVLGTAGVAAGLVAVTRGWRPRRRGLLAGGALAIAILVAAPPMGTTDTMDYAVYGRMAVLGYNPHVVTPREFRATGDAVGAVAPHEWENVPSVYGPLATAAQWAASSLAGDSASGTVFWLKVWNALAFLAAALALDRLAGRDPARRVRVALLWTLNPLMLWALIGGAHVDGLAAGLAVAGLAAMGTSARRSGLAGVALGAAAAVKAPYLLVGAGMLWLVRRSPRALAALVAGVAATLAAGYAVVGPEAVVAVARRSGAPSWNTPWRLLLLFTGSFPSWLPWASLVLAVLLAVRLLRHRLDGPVWLGPALAVCLAWVVTTPVYYPWYEALVFPLIAVAPATRLDWIQLARALVATLGSLPGITSRLGDAWLRSAVLQGPVPYIVPAALLCLAFVVIATPARARWAAYGGEVTATR